MRHNERNEVECESLFDWAAARFPRAHKTFHVERAPWEGTSSSAMQDGGGGCQKRVDYMGPSLPALVAASSKSALVIWGAKGEFNSGHCH